MRRLSYFLSLVLFASGSAALAAQAPVHVLSVERRVYDILVDNKPAGSYSLQFSEASDGTTAVEAAATVHVSFFFKDYRYTLKAQELWRGEHLLSFSSDCVDDGKPCSVEANNSVDGLHYRVNGAREHLADGTTMAGSYWHMSTTVPAEAPHSYLEVDTGRVFKAHFKKVGDEVVQLGIQAQGQPCVHYRLSGDDQGDLWYDKDNRMVKHTCSDLGHRTTFLLKSVTRQ